MTAVRRVYRVTVTYPDGSDERSPQVRHFQSRSGATRYVTARRAGYEPESWFDGRRGIPPAESVTVEVSAPVDGWTALPEATR